MAGRALGSGGSKGTPTGKSGDQAYPGGVCLGPCRNALPAFLVVEAEGNRENSSDFRGPKVVHKYEVGGASGPRLE